MYSAQRVSYSANGNIDTLDMYAKAEKGRDWIFIHHRKLANTRLAPSLHVGRPISV